MPRVDAAGDCWEHERVKVDLRLLTGAPEEMAALQAVLDGAPGYAERPGQRSTDI